MVNDTSTLNGALQELGETMAANLTQQGVTSSASEGLTTLAGKILDIQTGGGSCYHIEFSEDSYVATGGSATLEIMLQENYAPKSGATVTVTGSDSSLYTGITDSTGLATVTVSVSATTTFTCSYQGVSDTCTVTATVYLINDDASVDNSSTLFGNSIGLRNSGTNTTGWNNAGYYTVKNTKSSSESMRVIAPLTGLTGDFTLEYDSYLEATDGASGFVIYNSNTSFVGLLNDGGTYTFFYNDGSYHETNLSSGVTRQEWVHFKFIVEGTNFTLECYENDVLQYTTTQTIHFNRSSSTMYGFEVKWTYNRITRYKNIKAEAL